MTIKTSMIILFSVMISAIVTEGMTSIASDRSYKKGFSDCQKQILQKEHKFITIDEEIQALSEELRILNEKKLSLK